MFGVLAGFDARDPLTQFALNASLPANYTQFLDAGGLKARSCWARASHAASTFPLAWARACAECLHRHEAADS